MKKNQFSVVALLTLLFAMSNAFTVKMKAEAAAKPDPSYYWFAGNGTVFHAVNTKADEGTITGCIYTLAVCEQAYTSSQLKNPANPSLGVKATEVGHPQDIIRKNTN